MCFALGTVCWARQEDADRPCLDTHDKIFLKTVPQNLSQGKKKKKNSCQETRNITGNLAETFLKSFSKYSYFDYREHF